MKNRTTIKDIAKKAGVTHSTVSRVINNNPAISDETKMRVMSIIKEENYQPNLIARGLVRKKTRAFALIAPVLDPHVFPIIKGLEEACQKNDYALMLFSTNYWADESLSYFKIVENWLVDGILILNDIYYKDVPDNVKRLQNENVPFIFINKFLGAKRINTVSIDNYDAVCQVVEHLADLGHKRIGTMAGVLRAVDGVERFEGYKRALKEFNLKYDDSVVGYGDYREDKAYNEMKRILNSSSRRPTAMFCANDRMAFGVIKAVQENGLKVPEDVAVVGYDDIEAGRYFKPSLSTIRPPLEDIGDLAVKLMIKKIKDHKSLAEEVPLKTELIIRESSGT